ncbi:HupE/UreJ family protein [Hyphomicrobium facile]|uniref:Urease accessory protein n=1 Tax=Hyphomicrobium facile TaxID=51670 RepID=A0A1I7NU25_9HYPH|nr:HupE/UreJ family protein [Hyphomicrobium facile]SFV38166.1 urease accessory protein [Hyphomicrobium facile]
MRHSRVQHVLKAVGAGSILMVAAVAPASAHVGLGAVHTFSQGFLHPMNGLDHMIAMLAVGLYAANLGGRAFWLVPLAFVGTMIFGGLLGYYGWPLPMVEAGIGLSVVVMSMAIALGVRLPTVAAMALVGTFALFHGHAHGNEGVGLGFAFLPYAAGFVVATALLHASGLALGAGFKHVGAAQSSLLNRLTGGLGAIAGISLLTGLMAA